MPNDKNIKSVESLTEKMSRAKSIYFTDYLGLNVSDITKLRKEFYENDWKVLDAAQPAHNKPPPLCYSSVWLSMNVLVLDPKTVCVEESEVYQAEQIDKLGMEVIPVPFRDAYPFGGALHCATTDVYREGSCEDYFPKQN